CKISSRTRRTRSRSLPSSTASSIRGPRSRTPSPRPSPSPARKKTFTPGSKNQRRRGGRSRDEVFQETTMTAETLKRQFSDVFNRYAAEGISAFTEPGAATAPALSHVCFKFSSQEAYAEYVEAAREIGQVTQEEFHGKQITWCKLAEPLQKGDLTL